MSVGVLMYLVLTRCLYASGLHFTYPKDKQHAQEVKDKLIAAHDVEANGGEPQVHQVCPFTAAHG